MKLTVSVRGGREVVTVTVSGGGTSMGWTVVSCLGIMAAPLRVLALEGC